EQNYHYRQPYPGHEAEHRTERAIGLVVAPKMRRVPREQDRYDHPSDCREYAAPTDPAPLSLFAARPIAKEDCNCQCDSYQKHRPAANSNDQFAEGGKPDVIHRRWKDNHRGQSDQHEHEGAKREIERQNIQLDEAAPLTFAVDDVESIK